MCNAKSLISFIANESELKECGKIIKTSVGITFNKCVDILHNLNVSKIDEDLFKTNSVIDYLHDELNTGHWSTVSLDVRKAFTVCSFVKAFIILNRSNDDVEINLKEALKCVDLGLLLGAPLEDNSDLLLKTASFLTTKINDINSTPVCSDSNSYKKRKNYDPNSICNTKSKIVVILKCPSIEKFNNDHYKTQIPVKLQECMEHWPAMKKWEDVNYLLSIAGERTVPIEIGSNYADENWGQKLMTLRAFIETHFLKVSENIGYLAQHNLFDQIIELREDIHVPEYCCLSNNYEECCEPDINAWLGPAKTVSPLHYDPKDNILAQVFGTKHIVLFSPNDSVYLYPHEDKLLFNTARVDPLKPDVSTFPDFSKATMYECILEPGEMLYIPAKWWHHITALDKSFSVSFWWK